MFRVKVLAVLNLANLLVPANLSSSVQEKAASAFRTMSCVNLCFYEFINQEDIQVPQLQTLIDKQDIDRSTILVFLYQPARSQPTTTVTQITEEGSDFLFLMDITVTVTVDTSMRGVESTSIEVNIARGSTLLQVMQNAQQSGIFSFETRNYSIGPFVTSVNGEEAREDHREYWALINGGTGQLLPLGVGKYLPSDNENIIFKLSTYSENPC